ncbi:alternative ribosome rescue aminoacyl-tRNA hydrolase ArfB [uncultured Maribacter sp.]|uniref:alternative ribosome rescue aminoacyl-tRNA hydrolase ArfB n=1 Tax=uncultured Maribacter sp. TaxID=431308 RepID=UPI00260499CB|nr:alternative ribosome rescue aminoacyl-tRNA hydrolase ArfB [uncultured Maribacter sp.]
MNKTQLVSELTFKAIRSSGAGGQHVNKVSSKVELSFNVTDSKALRNIERERILRFLANRLNKENILILQCDESRSQHKNKELVVKRFFLLLENALKVPKVRRKTKPKKSAIEKRLKSKKRAALKKMNRRKPNLD